MLAKRVTVYLLASVFSVAIHVPTAMSQSKDVNCDKQETLSDLSGKCNDDNQYNETDPTITNSTTKGDNGTTKGDDANSGDHDNGHGNDPDHDDSSNPGKGGGNHGTGNNGKGNGPGK